IGGTTMSTQLAELIRKCESLAKAGRIDEAETIMSYIEKAQADEEEDGEYDDPSNPSMDDEEDGEDDDSVDKVLRTPRKAGRGINWDTNTDVITDRGRGHENLGGASLEADHVHRPTTYQLSTTAAVGGQQTRHKFTQKVDEIQRNESVGRDVAMTRA